MPLDAVCLAAVADELRANLVGARVDKIAQPERDELGIAVRSMTLGNVRLLISANQSHARIHLTSQSRENPSTPPMFCMLLRKHLGGARITDIVQPANERVVSIEMDAANEMGERVKRVLVAELQGRHSNIILVDENNRIVECLKRVDYEMSEQRPVLPGLFYHLPPKPDKAAPDDSAAWRELETLEEKAVIARFSGISPLIAREICHTKDVAGFIETVKSKHFTPMLLRDGDRPVDFSYMPITQYGALYSVSAAANFSELLDGFFTAKDTREHLQKRASGLRKTVKTAIDRTKRKLVLQSEEYATTQNRERLRECGDLLMANLHLMKRGDAKAVVQDFYHGDAEIAIALDVTMTPHQNASKYYKNYTKAKTAQEMLTVNMARGRLDLEYLESVMNALDNIAGEQDIREIQEELVAAGFLPKPRQGGKAQKPKPSKPLVFTSQSGVNIYVGRNNRQNDELTLKLADKSDMWLHVQKIAGSHVIIDCRGGVPDEATLLRAAVLAATYSQARNGEKVPVDYTPVKYVKKMQGGKPGMVIYDKFRTLFVDPEH
ncbi:fibronectin-binding protein A [Clostridia bacterium]|nr:fibronectin-binding protein A [Clostridia bacterium]